MGHAVSIAKQTAESGGATGCMLHTWAAQPLVCHHIYAPPLTAASPPSGYGMGQPPIPPATLALGAALLRAAAVLRMPTAPGTTPPSSESVGRLIGW